MANKTVTTNDFSAITPADADNVLVPESNGADIDTGLTQTGIKLGNLIVAPLYRFALGSTGTPLEINAALVKYYGSGGMFYRARDNNSVAEQTDEVVIQAANSNVPVELDTHATTVDSEFDIIRLMRGNVTLKGTIKYTATGIVEVGFVDNRSGDVNCTIASNSDTLPTLHINGGVVTNDATITNARVAGGKLIHNTAVISTLEIFDGGVVEYNHTSATMITVYSGGVLDLTQVTNYKTITTLTRFAGSTVIFDPKMVTITTENRYDTIKVA